VKQPKRALELMRAAIGELHEALRAGRFAKECAGKIEARLTRRLTRLKRRSASISSLTPMRAANRAVHE
jgi:hypothetical protein